MRSGLRFAAAAIATAVCTSASAGDWEECTLSTPDFRVSACSRVIKETTDPKKLALAHIHRANGLASRGDKDHAMKDFAEAVAKDPDRKTYIEGLILAMEGHPDEAIAKYEQALAASPNDPLLHNSVGNVFNSKGDRAKAISAYSKALDLDSTFAVAYSNRGYVHYLNGNLDGAIADLEKAVALSPRFASAYNRRGIAYSAKGERDKALADYNMAIELDPKLAVGYSNRGNAYGNKGELERAITDLDVSILLDPKSLAYNNRGNVYIKKDELDRALADLNKAIELDGKYALAYLNRGLVYEKLGQQDRAIGDYRAILELPAISSTDQQRREIARQRIARASQAQRGAIVVAPPKRVALVIGNSAYMHAGKLANPSNDTRSMAEALRRLNFGEVIERYDLSREAMGQAVKDFGDRAEGAEWAVVFFAGHGMEMNGVSYLIPTDAKLARDTHVADEAISLTSVQTKVDGATKLGLVMLDSCRNNPFISRMARSGSIGRSVERGLAIVEPEGNVLVAYSAKHGTTAEDGSGVHSPFTEALLSYIEEPGLEINFLFRKVRDEVRKKTDRRQEPFLYGSLSSEPLYFKEPKAEVATK
jgi:tetratricopeptide (TPR) repeat protein